MDDFVHTQSIIMRAAYQSIHQIASTCVWKRGSRSAFTVGNICDEIASGGHFKQCQTLI